MRLGLLSVSFFIVSIRKQHGNLFFSGVLRKCLKTQVILNAICLAVGHVHLAVYELIATKNHSGSHAPSEEKLIDALLLLEYLSRIFFHGKVERESMHLVIGQFQVFLCFPNRY